MSLCSRRIYVLVKFIQDLRSWSIFSNNDIKISSFAKIPLRVKLTYAKRLSLFQYFHAKDDEGKPDPTHKFSIPRTLSWSPFYKLINNLGRDIFSIYSCFLFKIFIALSINFSKIAYDARESNNGVEMDRGFRLSCKLFIKWDMNFIKFNSCVLWLHPDERFQADQKSLKVDYCS